MKYETIVETTPDGRLALRLVIVPDEPEDRPDRKNDDGQGYVVILPVEEDQEERGVVTWQM